MFGLMNVAMYILDICEVPKYDTGWELYNNSIDINSTCPWEMGVSKKILQVSI